MNLSCSFAITLLVVKDESPSYNVLAGDECFSLSLSQLLMGILFAVSKCSSLSLNHEICCWSSAINQRKKIQERLEYTYTGFRCCNHRELSSVMCQGVVSEFAAEEMDHKSVL